MLSGTGSVLWNLFTGDLVALLSIENKQQVMWIRLTLENK